MPIKLTKNFRKDIAGLRGIAIIFVIINHTFLNFFESGYLGVDIFFVISGFVITKSITENRVDNITQFLSNFYAKRLKRILPALIVLIISTLLFSSFFIPDSSSFFILSIRALAGISNINIYRGRVDYFGPGIEFNPLAHTWSLGVEEQFYFIYPLILICCGYLTLKKQAIIKTISIVLFFSFISLMGFIYFLRSDLMASYFLMPLRFWQIASGGLCYMICKEKINLIERNIGSYKIIRFLAFIFLIFIVNLPYGNIGAKAILACLFTNLLIVKTQSEDIVFKIISNKIFIHLGKLSYSLYLWHWFILTFSKYTIGEDYKIIPFQLLIIYLISFISYKFIELPFISLNTSSKNIIGFGMFILGSLILQVNWAVEFSQKLYIPSVIGIRPTKEWGKILDCNGALDLQKFKYPFQKCLGGERKIGQRNIYLLGDSHAAQLTFMVNKLIKGSNKKLKFINTQDKYDFPYTMWEESNNNILETKTLKFLKNVIKPQDIIILTFHKGRLNNNQIKEHINLKKDPFDLNSLDESKEQLINFINFLKIKNSNLILIRDTPLLKKDFGPASTCALIEKIGISNIADICSVDEAQDLHTRTLQDHLFDQALLHSKKIDFDLNIWDPTKYIPKKDGKFYYLKNNGSYAFDDQNHISIELSEDLAKPFKMFLIEKNIW